jgi:hypothetical protein
MNAMKLFSLALDPTAILRARGFAVDKWQYEFLLSKHRQILSNGCRQAGKSTFFSALALHKVLFTRNSTVLILSPVQHQSAESFHEASRAFPMAGESASIFGRREKSPVGHGPS